MATERETGQSLDWKDGVMASIGVAAPMWGAQEAGT